MSANECAPDDVFNKYCAELSVPRLITTWSVEMSKQQLIDTLRNRGYRFDLHQFSTNQLLQLLRESDILYHQVKKDGNECKGESSITAKIMNEKRKKSEQHTQLLGSGALETQVQRKNNISSPRDSSEAELESVGREGEGTAQDGQGSQAVAVNPLATRSSPEDWREGAAGAKAGKDPEFRQRVDTLQRRLVSVAIKSGTHLDTTIKARRLEGHYFGVRGLMTDVFGDIKKHTREKWEMMEMKRSWGVKLVPEAVDEMQEAKAEISKIEVSLAQLRED
ncbi:hypothetical protein KC343_g127 [Hortaea werneckii]|uniref:Uncharacterized protein n=1 Tax=Hortaea werneckii TaxID=91943 RepID=A0A3M7HIE2_HORWE|nr:hypothetical protein KC352_g1237 [Hortaea werneckii]KAI7573125.1 hypothetical protein KC317_g147 [Hortaea werneckii]KAI7628534.1 hypothetical protein KC346_g123 [Hortaea werneckii]KAI7638351.1 hypothetical protein KC343_g127 [Hortaea werneckii]KAI7683982.1 hypothetical protein KC319_g154 [Hortaea werneckii]